MMFPVLSASALKMSTGRRGNCRRTALRTSIPFMSGSASSSTMTSGRNCSAFSSAMVPVGGWRPPPAPSRSPASWEISLRATAEPSATRIRMGVMRKETKGAWSAYRERKGVENPPPATTAYSEQKQAPS